MNDRKIFQEEGEGDTRDEGVTSDSTGPSIGTLLFSRRSPGAGRIGTRPTRGSSPTINLHIYHSSSAADSLQIPGPHNHFGRKTAWLQSDRRPSEWFSVFKRKILNDMAPVNYGISGCLNTGNRVHRRHPDLARVIQPVSPLLSKHNLVILIGVGWHPGIPAAPPMLCWTRCESWL